MEKELGEMISDESKMNGEELSKLYTSVIWQLEFDDA